MGRLTGNANTLKNNDLVLENPVLQSQLCHMEGINIIKPEDKTPIQINTLWGCEDVKAYYYLIGYDVVNIMSGHVKAVNLLNTKRQYPYVTLETVHTGKNKKCLMHHLIALAYIKNEPYKIIEHLDDDAMNYDVDNLMFSDQVQNIKRAFENGHTNRVEKIFELTLKDGSQYTGSIKELSFATRIPRGTLYERLYQGTPGRTVESITEIKSTEYRTGTDR